MACIGSQSAVPAEMQLRVKSLYKVFGTSESSDLANTLGRICWALRLSEFLTQSSHL